VNPYPLKTCLVTGIELGSMGKPITKLYNGQEIKLCCKPCIKKFDANPTKCLGKLKSPLPVLIRERWRGFLLG